MSAPISSRRRARSKGQEMVEFTLIFLPFFGFLFLTIDLGWAIFTRSTLQEAVREGCRYAVTSQTTTDKNNNALGQVDSIKTIVQQNAIGLLGSSNTDPGWSKIGVNFYAPSDLSTPLTAPTSSSSTKINVYPNIVEVTVTGYRLPSLTAPLFHDATALSLSADSADRMESAPPTGSPNYSDFGY